ncbi:MAG: CBS domain-containing protein [Candidatus Thermoplasmatota archaeon]|jgi:predicted transcriptional regulator|nr:CBS domain-containing protein [Candidatus Thermoplasmatota archaeon]MCL5791077.1 CBS domain-containing protein [Candidatus Thermoplasmatota archaeon]
MLPSVQELGKMRKSLGISQKEIASACGLSQSYIARMEKGDINPTYENVKKIYNYLSSHTEKTKNIDIIASKIMTRNVIICSPSDYVLKALDLMKERGVSQIPVISDDGRVVGTLSESDINELLIRGVNPESLKKMSVSRIMSSPLPQLPMETPVSAIYPMLRFSNAVLIMEGISLKGIITKADILKAVEDYAEPRL